MIANQCCKWSVFAPRACSPLVEASPLVLFEGLLCCRLDVVSLQLWCITKAFLPSFRERCESLLSLLSRLLGGQFVTSTVLCSFDYSLCPLSLCWFPCTVMEHCCTLGPVPLAGLEHFLSPC